MGKISPVSAKYIVHASITIGGVVDRPDVIGAIFGQTEGLLGADLELRELQRSGRIGRIEVKVDTRSGKTVGDIIIPSSLDKAETVIVAAALEIIQRIGPCTAKIRVEKIEDVRISKRTFVVERAKELLKHLMDTTMPDSQELADEVAYSVRIMEIQEYGSERLPAGPGIDETDELIIVEGRADVICLLKHGFKNTIAINGTNIPDSVIELTKKKIATVFVDGDRGGNLIIKEMTERAELDFVAKAPDGKEVEELTKKEIHKALRAKVSIEQAKMEMSKEDSQPQRRSRPQGRNFERRGNSRDSGRDNRESRPAPSKVNAGEKKVFKEMLEGLIGTRGAHVLDAKLNVLGKVPSTELVSTMQSLNDGIYAVVFDGSADSKIVQQAEKSKVKVVVCMDSKVRAPNGVEVLVGDKL